MRWFELAAGVVLLAGWIGAQDPSGGKGRPGGDASPQDPARVRPEAADQDEVPPAQRPRPASAEKLFALFSEMKGLECRFEEEKHLALLALPLRSRGKLYFLRPGYLARRVEAPQEQAVTITPTELRMKDAEGEEVIDLRQAAEVRHFVTSLVQVFAGNLEQLERAYRVQYAADPDPEKARHWSLVLTPRERPLTEMMRSLTLRGEGEAVGGIEVVEPNGDRTVTRIVAADPERQFTPEEKLRWFGIEPRGQR